MWLEVDFLTLCCLFVHNTYFLRALYPRKNDRHIWHRAQFHLVPQEALTKAQAVGWAESACLLGVCCPPLSWASLPLLMYLHSFAFSVEITPSLLPAAIPSIGHYPTLFFFPLSLHNVKLKTTMPSVLFRSWLCITTFPAPYLFCR